MSQIPCLESLRENEHTIGSTRVPLRTLSFLTSDVLFQRVAKTLISFIPEWQNPDRSILLILSRSKITIVIPLSKYTCQKLVERTFHQIIQKKATRSFTLIKASFNFEQREPVFTLKNLRYIHFKICFVCRLNECLL